MSANQSPTAGTGASLTSAPDAAHHSEITPMNNTPLTWEGDRAPFAKAFIAAQKATEAVKKAATNPAFKTKYADLSEVVEATVPALNANGIGVIQVPGYDGELVSVTTVFVHESGASVTGVLRMRPRKTDPQGVGTAITYARRYALLAMTGAAPEDDDGNAASQHRAPPPPPADPVTTLANRADGLVGALNAAATADDLEKVWGKGAKLCADLDLKDPDKLAVITALYEARRDELTTNPFTKAA